MKESKVTTPVYKLPKICKKRNDMAVNTKTTVYSKKQNNIFLYASLSILYIKLEMIYSVSIFKQDRLDTDLYLYICILVSYEKYFIKFAFAFIRICTLTNTTYFYWKRLFGCRHIYRKNCF